MVGGGTEDLAGLVTAANMGDISSNALSVEVGLRVETVEYDGVEMVG